MTVVGGVAGADESGALAIEGPLGLQGIVGRVWHHFLVEQFVPYINGLAEASH